ncbi:MAG: SDH family Clp fold serine proteinase [Rhodopila sp.]
MSEHKLIELGPPAPGAATTALRPPILLDQTQVLIAKIESLINEPLITYWNSRSGSICDSDVLGLYGVLRDMRPAQRMSLFIKSDGGSGQASLRMINLLRQQVEHLTVLVPLECASAGTMLALGANAIQMGPLAHLSAVDTSLTHDLSPLDRDNQRVKVSQDELGRAARLFQGDSGWEVANPYSALFQHVHPLVIGAVDRASALSTRLCIEILGYHMSDTAKAEAISHTLNAGYPSHSYPITLREAGRIGLNVESLPEVVNHALLELNAAYSEMGQRAMTDFDDRNAHDNSILTIIEGSGRQVFYQQEKDWHYRTEERRWITLNDRSSWRRAERTGSVVSVSDYPIR